MIFCIEKQSADQKFRGFGSFVCNENTKQQLGWSHKPYIMLSIEQLHAMNHDPSLPGEFRVIAGLFVQAFTMRGFRHLLVQEEIQVTNPSGSVITQ